MFLATRSIAVPSGSRRDVSFLSPIPDFQSPFSYSMLLVPTAQQAYGRLDGPIRADHAILVCDQPSSRLSASTTCLYPHHPHMPLGYSGRPGLWATPIAPPRSAFRPPGQSRPTSLIFEPCSSKGRTQLAPVVTPRSSAAPTPPPRGAIATNPRVRRRSTADGTPQVPPPVPPHAAVLESMKTPPKTTPAPPPPLLLPSSSSTLPARTVDASVETDSCTYSSQESKSGPIKTNRPSRRSSGAKELFQGLRRSAKKKMERLRRSVSTGRLANRRQGCYGMQPVEGGKGSTTPLCRRCSAPNIPRATSEVRTASDDSGCPWDVFPRTQMMRVHADRSYTLRMERHPQAAFGFFVAQEAKRGRGGMFISRINRPEVASRLLGYLEVGDQLLAVEDVSCANLSLNQLYDIVGKRLVVHLRILPHAQRR